MKLSIDSSPDSDDYIAVPREMHTTGCAALSGAIAVILQTRARLAECELDLRAAARRMHDPALEKLADVLSHAEHDLLARRQAMVEMHRDFRACDTELTPTRPPSDSAWRAYQISSNFPKPYDP